MHPPWLARPPMKLNGRRFGTGGFATKLSGDWPHKSEFDPDRFQWDDEALKQFNADILEEFRTNDGKVEESSRDSTSSS